MDAIAAHLQEKWIAYVAILLCASPLIYVFRKQVIPTIWYACEMLIYMTMFHLVLNVVVRVARWFKIESTFMTDKVDTGWTTPLFTFWDRAVYKPSWLFYFELIAAILIVAGVIRFRPYKAQPLHARRQVPTKGMAGMVRPSAAKRSGVRK